LRNAIKSEVEGLSKLYLGEEKDAGE